MENINLDDYHVSIEYLNNFPDNNIENWIASGKPGKINKKLKKISKSGGSFLSNKYQVTSTDTVLVPFMFKKGDHYVIEYAETRHIHFFPAIDTSFANNCILKMENLHVTENTIDNDKTVNKSDSNDKNENNGLLNKSDEKKLKKTKRKNDEDRSSIADIDKSPKTKKRKLDNEPNSHSHVITNQVHTDVPVNSNSHKKRKSTEHHEHDINIEIKKEMMISNDKPAESNGERVKKHKKKKSKHVNNDIKNEPVTADLDASVSDAYHVKRELILNDIDQTSIKQQPAENDVYNEKKHKKSKKNKK